MCVQTSGQCFFPPSTDEELEEIKPFFNDLPIFQSALLDGKEGNDIKAFFENEKLGVKALNPKEMISEWIIPQYAQPDKPSVEENWLHVRYLFKVWDKFSGYQHQNLRAEIRETPILRAYKVFSQKSMIL